MSIQNNELMTTTGNRFILPQAVETTFTAEELAEDMDGIQLNFRQVKVPAGGTLQYEIPTEDPDVPDYDRFLEGIILFHHPSNAYWPDVEDGGDGENVPPQCQALDGKFGHGSPGGLCASCGYNRFGTRGKGKACKNMHMVYLLRSGEFMPLQIIVDFPFLLLSKVCMDVVKLYEPQIVSKQIILLDTENRNKQTYYLPILPHLDCLSEKSVLSPDGSELREGVLDLSRIGSEGIFHIAGLSRFYTVVRLDVLESMLKRGARGVKVTPMRTNTIEGGAVDG